MAETSTGLLDRLQNQADPEAWKRLVDIYDPLLRKWLGRDPVLRVEADDLVQDILVTVVRKLPEFRRQRVGSFRCWLRVITGNRVNLFWRRQRNRFPVVDGEAGVALISMLEDPDSQASRQWDTEYNRHVVQRGLSIIESEFRPATWRAFQRHVVDGISAAEAAAELETTVGAVLIARWRILKRLREVVRGLID